MTIRSNITGDPSIIFHMYHENNKTCIRGKEDKIVRCIKGFDANALFMNPLMQPMPSVFTVICQAEKELKVDRQSLYTVQYRQWLSWVPDSKGIHSQTPYNSRKMALGKRHMDGSDIANVPTISWLYVPWPS